MLRFLSLHPREHTAHTIAGAETGKMFHLLLPLMFMFLWINGNNSVVFCLLHSVILFEWKLIMYFGLFQWTPRVTYNVASVCDVFILLLFYFGKNKRIFSWIEEILIKFHWFQRLHIFSLELESFPFYCSVLPWQLQKLPVSTSTAAELKHSP